jgi:hypothetical protein
VGLQEAAVKIIVASRISLGPVIFIFALWQITFPERIVQANIPLLTIFSIT